MDISVTDAPDSSRYEARHGDTTVGSAEYRLEGDRIVFTHTKVDDELEGEGVGGQLARGALDDARRRGLSVVPECSFIREWIDRHDDYADLVAEGS
jgi:uncharacterized protein